MKTFYDPHPGMAGCTMRLPENIRIIVQSLDGASMGVDDAMDQLIDVCQQEFGKSFELKVHHNYIGLTFQPDSDKKFPLYSWRVIRFSEMEREFVQSEGR